MNRSTLNIMLAIAVISGLAVTIGIYRYLRMARTSQTAAAIESTIVVASKKLSPGVVLNETHMRTERVPGGTAPEGTFNSTTLLLGRVLRSPVAEGAVINNEVLLPPGRSAILGDLPEGYRAVNVLVDPQQHPGELVNTGDHVDVVVAMVDQSYTKLATAKLVLQNVKVLRGIGDEEGRRERGSKVPVTLAVQPWQAERLALAQQIGQIQLMVRGYEDEELVRTSGITWDTLLPYDQEAGIKGRAFEKIELIRGADRQQWRFLDGVRLDDPAGVPPAAVAPGGRQ